MEIRFSADEERSRAEARAWLAANVPTTPRPTELRARAEYDRAWQRRMHDAGWAGIAWPKEYGGRGASLMEQLVWYEEYARAGAPDISTLFVGLDHACPTLIACGSDAQKAEHLPRILRGDVIWCQGFSEPNAGSDLASLQTRAVIEGDELVVTGQKIWTSFAHVAEFQELLVRTDPEAPRHRGISWVICPMGLPGMEIRPITTLTGESDFCEVFYDAVRIPLANVVGRLNDGWRVAMATLSFERGTAFLSEQVRIARRVDELIATARAAGALAIGTCGAFGEAYDFRSAKDAQDSALSKCKGDACRVVATVKRGCAALAVDYANACGGHGVGKAPRLGAAQNVARKSCYADGAKE